MVEATPVSEGAEIHRSDIVSVDEQGQGFFQAQGVDSCFLYGVAGEGASVRVRPDDSEVIAWLSGSGWCTSPNGGISKFGIGADNVQVRSSGGVIGFHVTAGGATVSVAQGTLTATVGGASIDVAAGLQLHITKDAAPELQPLIVPARAAPIVDRFKAEMLQQTPEYRWTQAPVTARTQDVASAARNGKLKVAIDASGDSTALKFADQALQSVFGTWFPGAKIQAQPAAMTATTLSDQGYQFLLSPRSDIPGTSATAFFVAKDGTTWYLSMRSADVATNTFIRDSLRERFFGTGEYTRLRSDVIERVQPTKTFLPQILVPPSR